MIASTGENKGEAPAPGTSPGKSSRDAGNPPPDDAATPRERGGPAGPEPTRYGDWERKGRCIDF